MNAHSTNIAVNIDRLRIATPCPISWEQMTGDNRVRFCAHCQLNVYNISELSRREAETLVASSEGRLCTKLYRRADGTILTKDCPVGLRALRMRVSKRAAAVFAAIVSIASVAFGQQSSAKDEKTACTPQTRITQTPIPAEKAANLLAGNVVDPNGAVVPGATVTIVNTDSKETMTTTTNDAGRFKFASAKPGTYSVTVEFIGFNPVQVGNVIIQKDQLTNINTTFELSDVTIYPGTIGIVELAFEPVDTRAPHTTIIKEQMIRRFPIQ
jgi:plastocyanin